MNAEKKPKESDVPYTRISQRRRREFVTTQRRFRTLFERAPFSVQIVGKNGKTLEVNAAWRRLWQVSEAEARRQVIGKYNILDDVSDHVLKEAIHNAFAGKATFTPPIYYDPKERGYPGRPRWTQSYNTPIKDEHGEVQEVLIIHQDVTDYVEKERELQTARDAAEVASRLKSAFLANLSHEVRTPLFSILGYTELLKETRGLDEEKKNYIAVIEKNAQALVKVIDDILDFSRIEAGAFKVEKSPVHLIQVIREAIAFFKEASEKHHIPIIFDDVSHTSDMIISDHQRLKQILVNVIGNALKFTRSGEVRITLKDEPHALGVVVKDTGIGIRSEEQSKLFKPFSQIDSSRSRLYGGTGLGLALSRRLAQELGGDLTLLESTLKKGSSFELIIPL